MKTNEQLLVENRRLRLKVSRLKSELRGFRQEKKDKEKSAKWQDEAHAKTMRLYPE